MPDLDARSSRALPCSSSLHADPIALLLCFRALPQSAAPPEFSLPSGTTTSAGRRRPIRIPARRGTELHPPQRPASPEAAPVLPLNLQPTPRSTALAPPASLVPLCLLFIEPECSRRDLLPPFPCCLLSLLLLLYYLSALKLSSVPAGNGMAVVVVPFAVGSGAAAPAGRRLDKLRRLISERPGSAGLCQLRHAPSSSSSSEASLPASTSSDSSARKSKACPSLTLWFDDRPSQRTRRTLSCRVGCFQRPWPASYAPPGPARPFAAYQASRSTGPGPWPK